jgi:hypothetical protein
VPTYKWMQVKRNVPKPAGRCFISYYVLETVVVILVLC